MTANTDGAGSRFVATVLVVAGLYSVVLGLFMLLSPNVFHDTLGAFGPFNQHFVIDNASFELPLGLLLLAALRRPAWRTPALAFATAHWALHTASHLLDRNHAAGEGAGWSEAAGLLLGTIVLAAALHRQRRQDEAANGSAHSLFAATTRDRTTPTTDSA